MAKSAYLGEWTVEDQKYSIRLAMHGTEGHGLCGFLTGGEKDHVGGTAYASPRPKSHGEGITADVSTICGHAHKDVFAAQSVAQKICLAVNETVCITAGIHVDNASDEELKRIRDNFSAAADRFISDYLRGKE